METPTIVYVMWWATLVVAVIIVLPLAVYLLHRALRAARQIERYAATALQAGVGVAGNTADIAVLEQTIAIATDTLGTAQAIEQHTGTIETVLASRSGRR